MDMLGMYDSVHGSLYTTNRSSPHKRYRSSLYSKSAIERRLIEKLELQRELVGHDGCVNCLNWRPDGNVLISGSDDRIINIYSNPQNPSNPSKTKMAPAHSIPTIHDRNILKVKFCGKGYEKILSGAMDGRLCLFEAETGKALSNHRMGADEIRDICPSLENSDVVYTAVSMGIISRTDLRMRLDSKVTLLKIPSFVTTNFDHKLSSKSGALGINPVRPQTLAVGSAGHVLLYDLRNPKFCEQEDGPGSRIRPVNYPHEVYGCGTMDSFNITSIDFNHKNEMLVNYMNHAPLVYGLNIPKAKVQCVQNAQSMQMFLEFVSHSYPELRANRAAKKKAEKKELREMRKAQKKSGNTENDGDVKTPKPSPHCPQVQVMKTKANELFVHEQYSAAIDIYSLAINLEPHPILYSNRALALKKRALPGDTYHSMLDCVSALKLDPLFHKCHFRMMDCMLSIDFPPTTIYKCLKDYRKLHPERADEDSVFLDLWNKVKARLHKGQKDMTMDEGDLCFDDNYDLIDGFGWSFSGGELVRTETTKKYKRNEGPPKTVVNQHAPLPVRTWRESFHGRSHADTMIKNACFIGESIIATGTDTGHVFFYDRPTQQLINIFRADSHIVNIVEPHPIDPLSAVAVSGIDDSIKLYTPYPSKVSSENDYKLSKMHQKYEIVNENVRHLEGSMHPAAQFGCTNQ